MPVGQDAFFGGGMAADHGFDTRQQFQLAERLGNIVVRAPFQSFDNISLFGAHRENNRRDGGKTADLTEYFKAGDIWEAEVENDNIGRFALHHFDALLPEAGGHDFGFWPANLECQRNGVNNLFVVFNYQHFHRFSPRLSFLPDKPWSL